MERVNLLEVLKSYLGNKQPKINILYEKLVADLSKNPSSEEIQDIVGDIVYETNRMNEFYKIDEGENYLDYLSELYLQNSSYIQVTDKKYGKGASKFIGEALKIYSDSSKL